MLIEHVLSSEKDKKPTIRNSEIHEFIEDSCNEITILYEYDNNEYAVSYNKTRGGKTWYPNMKFPKELNMPQIGKPILLTVKQIRTN